VLHGLGRRGDLVALVALTAGAVFLLPKPTPAGIGALGLGDGARLALTALGMILVLRSNRIINFAQVQLGLISGLVFYELVNHQQLVLLVHMACPGCVSGVPADDVYLQQDPQAFTQALLANHHLGWIQANFWLSLLIALPLAPLLSWLAYRMILSRFARAPRLVATVATIALGQVLYAMLAFLPGLFQDQQNRPPSMYIPLPDPNLSFGKAVFHIGDIATVVAFVAVCAGLALFFLRSRTGIAVRAAAENPQRAESLGISTRTLSSISWSMAGFLAGVGSILAVLATNGQSTLTGTDTTGLVEVLAVVAFARLANLPISAGAALLVGVLDQALFWNFGSRVPFQALLFVLVCGALLLQRHRASRAEQEANTAYLASREARPIPPELRRVPVVDAWLRWFAAAVVILIGGFPLAMSGPDVNLVSLIFVDAMLGLSLLVLTGWAGQISLGQMAFAAVGAYVTAVLSARFGLDIMLTLAIAGVAGAVTSCLVGIPVFRLRGIYLAVATVAFALGTTVFLLNPTYLGRMLPSSIDRPTLLGLSLDDEKVFYYFTLAFLVLTVAAVAGLRRSRTARALIAARDNEGQAQSFGINLLRVRLEAFAVSGFIAAVAGGLFAFHEHGVSAGNFTGDASINIFLMTVLGGLGSLAGPLLGAAYTAVFSLMHSPVVDLLNTGLGTLVVLMLFPGGLSSILYSARDAMLRRVATRHRIVVPSLFADRQAGAEDGRAPVAPNLGDGRRPAFVPQRYRLEGQWAKLREGVK
jgi:branched-chain amino acid transport system permease protein